MSAENRDDLEAIMRQMRYDLTALQAKLTELMTGVARLKIPEGRRVICGECGVNLTGPRALAEHRWTIHDGPEPAHWGEQ